MTIRVLPDLDPRIVRVPISDGTEITIQQIIDQLRDWEDEPSAMSYPRMILAEGKGDLGGGTLIGITATLQNAQIEFEERVVVASSGTIDGGGGTSTINDSTADFVSDGVLRGAWIVNFTDLSVATVRTVDDLNTLTTTPLVSGTGNTYEIGDVYKIWNIEQMDISGGNLIAIDTLGASISPIFTSYGNQVVKTSSVSATLQELSSIQYSSFNGGVTVDITSSYTGVVFPVGTAQQPVNNLTDALLIASTRGFDTFFILGDITIGSGLDFTGVHFVGEAQSQSTFTIDASALVVSAGFHAATVSGTLDGNAHIENCRISNLTFVNGLITECGLFGTITLGGSSTARFVRCYDDLPGLSTPTIDMGGSGQDLTIADYTGGITITNKSGADEVTIDVNTGRIILDATVTNGPLVVRGIGTLEDSSVGATITNHMVLPTSQILADKILRNKTITDPVTGIMTVYDDDGSTVLLTAQLYQDAAGAITYAGAGADRKERLT